MTRLLIAAMILLTAMPVLAQDNAPDYFVEAVVDNPTPFVGQRITYTFRFYSAVLFDACDAQTTIGCPEYVSPEFQNFWQQRVRDRDDQTTPSEVVFLNDRQYSVQSIETYLYPTRSGDINISSANIILQETVFRDEVILLTNDLTLQTRPLPDDAPEGFNGAVGQFEMSGTIDRQSLVFGDPLRLQITITGNGNVEQMTPPEIPVDSSWRIYGNDTTFISASNDSLRQTDTRIFEWLLVPPEPGTQVLPAINLHYFDPTVRNYRTINTTPITLDIIPPEDGQPVILPPIESTNLIIERRALPLKTILVVRTGESGKLMSIVYVVFWIIPPVAFALAGVWGWRNRPYRRKSPVQMVSPLTHARRHLSATGKGDTPNAHRMVANAIFAYFAAQLQLSSGELNASVLRVTMREHEIPAELAADVLACLDAANQARYTTESSGDPTRLVEQTNQALTQLDRFWKQA